MKIFLIEALTVVSTQFKRKAWRKPRANTLALCLLLKGHCLLKANLCQFLASALVQIFTGVIVNLQFLKSFFLFLGFKIEGGFLKIKILFSDLS